MQSVAPSFVFGYEQDGEYLIRTSLQREASLKHGVHKLFWEGNRGTVGLNWEQRSKKACVGEILQHTLVPH